MKIETRDMNEAELAEHAALINCVMRGIAAHLVKNQPGNPELKIDVLILANVFANIAGLALASSDVEIGKRQRREIAILLLKRIETVMEDGRARGVFAKGIGRLASQMIQRDSVIDAIKAAMGDEKPELNA